MLEVHNSDPDSSIQQTVGEIDKLSVLQPYSKYVLLIGDLKQKLIIELV